MSLYRFVLRDLFHYRKAFLAILFGTILSAAVLTGALILGDSVKYSLRQITELRLGKIRFAFQPGNRYFSQDLAYGIGIKTGSPAAPAMLSAGIAVNPENNKRINHIEVVGIDRRFTAFWDNNPSCPELNTAVISTNTAGKLQLKPGDDFLVRIPKQGIAPGNAPFVAEKSPVIAIRLKVKAIADDEQMGRFSLKNNQTAPYTVFISLDQMAGALGLKGKANVILLGGDECVGAVPTDSLLRMVWQPGDAGLIIQKISKDSLFELTSERIFIDDPTSAAVKSTLPQSQPFLTYLVNSFSVNGRSTPYSFITAAPPDFLGTDPGPDGIIINSWLASDLGANKGDSIQLKYFIMGSGRELTENSSTFIVKQVRPMQDKVWDRSLMPDFPGMSEAGNCRDWETGSPIDLKKIRQKDEDYWNDFKGTPKAFISLATGQRLWKNPFGSLTSIRFYAGAVQAAAAGPAILKKLSPARQGLTFSPVWSLGKESAAGSTDFGGLFLSLGFFIIISALLLLALLFSLHLQTRINETGVLSAIGFTKWQIFRILFTEGLVLAVAGGVGGALAGILYTRLMLLGLNTIWLDAVGITGLILVIKPVTLILGASAGALVAIPVLFIVLYRNMRKPAVIRARFGYASLKRGRFLTVVVLLALGTFSIIITASNRRTFYGPSGDAGSGTGGFQYWAESSIPLRHDPSTAEGIKEFALDDQPELKNVHISAIPKLEGDDASCLNLNRAARPAVLGIPTGEFNRRNAFSFISLLDGIDNKNPWLVLQKPLGPGVIPAFCDQTVITWGLQKKIGDTLYYKAGKGETIGLKLMGGLDNSVFQGYILISDSLFRIHFTSVSGFSTFLFDGPSLKGDSIAELLENVFRDYGLITTSSSARLASFNAVENTYLSVFTLLGSLGVLIGTFGLGLVLLRNIQERKQELALYFALGYEKNLILRMILVEYLKILLAGILLGTVSAATFILTSLLSPSSHFPWLFILLFMPALLLNGLLWVWLPVHLILKRKSVIPHPPSDI
ncbi:MAG: ABC transporter permease [Bacteroidales bacterium]